MAEELRIDRIDEALLRLLQNDARLSNRALADAVGLAPSSCLERVRRLSASGALVGIHAEVDPVTFGLTLQAMIAVRLKQHTQVVFEELREHILALPEVLNLFHVAGDEDFMVHVAVANAEHLRRLVWGGFTSRPQVDHVHTSLVFEYSRAPVRPVVHP